MVVKKKVAKYDVRKVNILWNLEYFLDYLSFLGSARAKLDVYEIFRDFFTYYIFSEKVSVVEIFMQY